jgi:hypothetical protein
MRSLVRLLRAFGGACLLLQAGAVHSAAADADEEAWKRVFTSFDTPFNQLLDNTAPETVAARFALDLPIIQSNSGANGSGAQGGTASSPTAQAGFKYVPLSSWFVAMNFLAYFRPRLKEPWNPDFTYAFGYDDWHPYTVSAQYANYGGNRLAPDRAVGEARTRFNQGTWSVAFKFPLPARLEELFTINETDSIGCAAGMNFTPRFTDLATNSEQRGKKAASLGCKYALQSNWYFNFNLLTYPSGKQQQPWDPDYTYGFGYFDWHPGSWSVQYNNYSGNRYPWRQASATTGHFRDGSITISKSVEWL